MSTHGLMAVPLILAPLVFLELVSESDAHIRFEFCSAEGKPEPLPDLAAQLVRSKVSVIVAYLTPAIAAAKQVTSEIPIVMVAAGDPVATGFIANLARLGGNITGTTIPPPASGHHSGHY
jgi:putative ABC transport system substrate-binding protein